MRPLRLELEGFTAFRDHTVLDFSTLDLFAITGPTGAGKSSLIDAIVYALYGRVPRVANRVEACIAQGIERMHVTLDFEVGRDRYRIFREARRQGHGNIRMERLDGERWVGLEERVRGVEDRVNRTLGLDFDGFTRSVLLPQGQFQEFLAGSPDKRREVLRGLLRLDVYERVRARAAEREKALKSDIGGIEQRLREDYADATPETRRVLEVELREASGAAGALAAEIVALDGTSALARVLADARHRFVEARAQQQEAEAELAKAREILRTGSERMEGVAASLAGAEAAITANPFDAALFGMLAGAVKVAQDLARSRTQLGQTEQALAAAGAGRDKARADCVAAKHLVGECERACAEAEAGARQAEQRNAAAVVQGELAIGTVCPVCGAIVERLPAIRCSDLESARASAQDARTHEAQARDIGAKAAAEVARAEANFETTEASLRDQESRLAQLGEQLAADLPPGLDPTAEALGAALKVQERARVERDQLEKRAQTLRTESARFQADLAEAQGSVSRLEGRVESAGEAMMAAAEEGRAAAESLREKLQAAGWTELAARAEKQDVSAPIQQMLTEARSRQSALQERIGRLNARIQLIDEQIEKRAALEQSLQAIKGQHAVANDLALMLRADRFQAFVQSEALRVLAEEGSRRLDRLSSGRYRLAVAANSQDFDVIDQWNADDARSVRTLSGGETFLASLALALALAEALPGLAAGQDVALDSMFLDEGFGSLDPEALDRAAEALDSLRASNRMVCVVTHLKELADRLPARVVVVKSESGSTLEVA